MSKNPFQHIDLRVNDIEVAWAFYSELLPAVGFEHGWRDAAKFSGFNTDGTLPNRPWFGFVEDQEHRPNANRISFWAESRGEVDELTLLLKEIGARNISGPRECPEYTPTYYAVFFEDPFGNCLEICHRID